MTGDSNRDANEKPTGRFRIKELARERGWSADDLARRSGLRFTTVQRLWQNRTANPLYATLKAIADAFEVPMEELEYPEASQPPEEHIRTPGLVNV